MHVHAMGDWRRSRHPLDAFESSGDQWGRDARHDHPVCAITDERYPAYGRFDGVANLQFLMMSPDDLMDLERAYVEDEGAPWRS